MTEFYTIFTYDDIAKRHAIEGEAELVAWIGDNGLATVRFDGTCVLCTRRILKYEQADPAAYLKRINAAATLPDPKPAPKAKKAGSRLLKVECVECHTIYRIARSHTKKGGLRCAIQGCEGEALMDEPKEQAK